MNAETPWCIVLERRKRDRTEDHQMPKYDTTAEEPGIYVDVVSGEPLFAGYGPCIDQTEGVAAD